LAGVGKVKLTQETEYPWSGRVRIKIEVAPEEEFALKLRVPAWAREAKVRLNHRAVRTFTRSPEPSPSLQGSGVQYAELSGNSLPVEGRGSARRALSNDLTITAGYAELRHAWKAGDIVGLDLRMDTELIEANPLVEETLGQVAVKRGPVVYCLESPDLPAGARVGDVVIPFAAKFLARYDQRLLGGVVVLEATLLAKSDGDWDGKLYREFRAPTFKPIKTRLIPYSVWANRGKSEMSVWLPLQSGN
jgi:DUF1680 family protein